MRALVSSFLFLILCPFAVQAQSSSCSCERDALLANVRNAETIFYGSIQKATMASARSNTIQLVLNISDPIRGPESGSVPISTALPQDCGVAATLGMHSLFVISKSDEVLTRCGGSGSHHYRQGHELYDLHNLVFAILVVEFVDKDPNLVRSWLKRRYRPGSSRREEMEGLLSMISELDTETIFTVTDNDVEYRNMVFVFSDGVLVDYLWKDEN